MKCAACLDQRHRVVTLHVGICPACGADCRTNPLWRPTPADAAAAIIPQPRRAVRKERRCLTQ